MPEVLIVVAVVGLLGSGAWRALSEFGDARAGREAARAFLGQLRSVAQQARTERRALAVEFDLVEPARWRVIADGNGNGVTTADMTMGIDVAETTWTEVMGDRRARLAVDRAVPTADGSGIVAAGSSPVQLGAAPRIVFTPRGTSSAGSILVAGRDGRAYAIRLLGTTQRLRLSCLSRAQVWEAC